MKVALGFALAFVLGFVCRAFGIPSPAPPVLMGALLVLAMSCGYVLVDRLVASQPARHARNCSGRPSCHPTTTPSKLHSWNALSPEWSRECLRRHQSGRDKSGMLTQRTPATFR